MTEQIGPDPGKPPGPSADAKPPPGLDQTGLPVHVVADELFGLVWMHFGRKGEEVPLRPEHAELLGRVLSNAARQLAPAETSDRDKEMLADGTEAAMELAVDPGMNIQIGGYELLILVGQLQLALRHPSNRGRSAEISEEIARHLQAHLAQYCPAVTEIVEAGWNLAMDVPTRAAEAMDPSRLNLKKPGDTETQQ